MAAGVVLAKDAVATGTGLAEDTAATGAVMGEVATDAGGDWHDAQTWGQMIPAGAVAASPAAGEDVALGRTGLDGGAAVAGQDVGAPGLKAAAAAAVRLFQTLERLE